jgi:hypothetical protein
MAMVDWDVIVTVMKRGFLLKELSQRTLVNCNTYDHLSLLPASLFYLLLVARPEEESSNFSRNISKLLPE